MERAILLLMLLAFSACIAEESGEVVEEPPPAKGDTLPTTTPPALQENAPPLHESVDRLNLSLLWSYYTREPVYGVDAGRSYVAAASYDNHLYLFNMSGVLLWRFETRGNAEAVALSERENYLVAASYLVPEARIYLFNLTSSNASLIWEKKLQNIVKGVAISEETNLVVVAAGDGRAYAYTLEGEPRWIFETQDSAWGVWDVATDGMHVALAGDDTYLYLLDTSRKLKWKRSGGRGSYIYGCALSSKLVAGATQDRMLYVYDINGKLLWKFRSGFSNHDVAIAENPELIALASWDKKVYLLSYDGRLITQLDFVQEPTSVEFSTDGSALAVGSRDGRVYLFGIKN
jgi:WD40 repeat protein